MFINKNQLEYVLTPDQYYSEEQHRVEMERLFIPGWHIVGVKSDMPNHGDFTTTELLGKPIQIRNFEGEYHTYLNVCSHRHCLLTKDEKGSSPTIQCQYHGWEYQANGHTAKIPDAGCFRPFDRENARLKKFRTETCGELIFASLSEEGPSLKEFLGDFTQKIEELFSIPRRMVWHWETEFDCNWKLPVENTLETYHLRCLHPETFPTYPTEENQTHVLDERFSTLEYYHAEDEKRSKRQEKVMAKIGGESTSIYMHHLAHPNIVVTNTDLYVHTQVYLPVSPTTSKTRMWLFSRRSQNRNLFARILAWGAGRYGKTMNAKIQSEDKSIFASQQKGIEASAHRGCIGTREERLYVFQQFIKDRCAGFHNESSNEDSQQDALIDS